MGNEFHKPLFGQSNAETLTNQNMPPVVFAMTCYTNDFDNPSTAQTLGETFVNAHGGAIAVLGATARSSVEDNYQFTQTFLDNLREYNRGWNNNGTVERLRLGDVFKWSKQLMGHPTINATYTLLGDPSLEVSIPQPNIAVTGASRTIGSRVLNAQYQLPPEVELPAKLELFVVNSKQETLAKWPQDVSQAFGPIQYELEGGRDLTNIRLVVYVRDGHGGDHVGGAPVQ